MVKVEKKNSLLKFLQNVIFFFLHLYIKTYLKSRLLNLGFLVFHTVLIFVNAANFTLMCLLFMNFKRQYKLFLRKYRIHLQLLHLIIISYA